MDITDITIESYKEFIKQANKYFGKKVANWIRPLDM